MTMLSHNGKEGFLGDKQYISLNAEIRFGKSCIKDIRIAVSDILLWLASGISYEEILVDFPQLKQ